VSRTWFTPWGWIYRPASEPAGHRMSPHGPLVLLAGLLLSTCQRGTGALPEAQRARLEAEGIVRRADDLMFRYTETPGRRSERREDRDASIIVTRQRVLLHKNAKVGLQITPASRGFYMVERVGSRVRLRAGRGRAEVLWSFEPPTDPAGWVSDIRAVIRRSRSEANP
jgi:hypothetical protein